MLIATGTSSSLKGVNISAAERGSISCPALLYTPLNPSPNYIISAPRGNNIVELSRPRLLAYVGRFTILNARN